MWFNIEGIFRNVNEINSKMHVLMLKVEGGGRKLI